MEITPDFTDNYTMMRATYENCAFAHSAKQLMEAQARDPKYKTMLCEAWKNQGTCDRGNNW